MDLTSLLSTMLSVDSVGSISQTAGVSIGEAQSVLGNALPSLLNGALEQSKGDDTAAGFDNALAQHAADDTSNVASFFSKVDLTDGGKIINHLLGGDGQAVSSISMKAGVSQKGTANILSAAAPLLMSLLGQQTSQSGQNASGSSTSGLLGSLLQNVDLGSMLGSLLGGGSVTAQTQVQAQVQPLQQQGQQSSGGLLGMLGNLFK